MNGIIIRLLDRFPVKEVDFAVPGYVDSLDKDHWLKAEIIESIRAWAQNFDTVDELKRSVKDLAAADTVESAEIKAIDMGTGEVRISLA